MAHKVQRWIDRVEAVFDSQSKVAPYSAGDTKTILTRGVNKPQIAPAPLDLTQCFWVMMLGILQRLGGKWSVREAGRSIYQPQYLPP